MASSSNFLVKNITSDSFTFMMKIDKYTHMYNEFVEEKFSPPGSKDVWLLRVFKMSYSKKNIFKTQFPVYKLQFGLVSRGNKQEDGGAISIQYQTGICFLETFKNEQNVDFIVNTAGQKTLLITTDKYSSITWIYKSNLPKEHHLNLFNGKPFLFRLILGYTPTDQVTVSVNAPSLADDLTSLANLLQTTEPDVTLHAKDGSTVLVSSMLLIARSDVFRTMLSVDMIEKKSKKVDLSEYRKATLTGFVDFLANDRVNGLKDIAEELFLIADKYNVIKLKMICEIELASQVTRDNRKHFLDLIELVPSNLIMDKIMANSQ